MRLKVGLLMVTLLTLASAAQADLTITVGDHNLLPNTAGQTVQIFVVSDTADSTQGLSFNAQLADGGTGAGGSIDGPIMTGDATGPGTLFETNHNPVSDGSLPPGFVNLGFAVQSGTVPIPVGSSLLATLTFDTTGFTTGTYPLILGGPDAINGDTQIAATTGLLSIVNGSITIVPEPSSIVLGLFAVAGFGAVAIRRRRAR